MIVIAVPLFADAVATIGTIPVTPDTHCTVIVPFPIETMFAMVCGGFVGFETNNCPEYGAVAGSGAGLGATLKVPVAVKVT